MADIEKTIKELKDGLDFKIFDNTCVLLDVLTVSDALELMKEQQPMKPVYDCPLIKCPKCKNSIDGLQKYCDECGQAIDWSKDGEQE